VIHWKARELITVVVRCLVCDHTVTVRVKDIGECAKMQCSHCPAWRKDASPKGNE